VSRTPRVYFGGGDAAADTVSKVMDKRRSKVSRGLCFEEGPIVKNFAAEGMEVVNNLPSGQDGWERPAPKPAPVYRRYPYEGPL
jgi:hypothetical protein